MQQVPTASTAALRQMRDDLVREMTGAHGDDLDGMYELLRAVLAELRRRGAI